MPRSVLEKMNKRGVIEMMETFIIIFVIFIIIGFLIFFFLKFSIADTKETAEEACMQSSSLMLLSVLDMPELQCSFKSTPQDCVDTGKLLAFIQSRESEKMAAGMCVKKIVFKQLYPRPGSRYNSSECNLNTMRDPKFPEKCGIWTVATPTEKSMKNKAARPISTPVSLYYPHKREYGLGELQITTYTTV